MIEKYSEILPLYYVMNPETEDLLPSGEYLRNGMIVTHENDQERTSLVSSGRNSDSQIQLAKVNNRWVEVTNLVIYTDINQVDFVGTYCDGTKKKFRRHVSTGWYVKKDTLPYETVSECLNAAEGAPEKKIYNPETERLTPETSIEVGHDWSYPINKEEGYLP